MRLFPMLAFVFYASLTLATDADHCENLWTQVGGEISPEIQYQDTVSIVKVMFGQAKIRKQLNRLRSDIELFLRGNHPTSQATKSLRGELGAYRHLSKSERRQRFTGIQALVLTEFHRFLIYIEPQVAALQAKIEPMAQALETKVKAMTQNEVQLDFKQRLALRAICKELARIHMQQEDLKAAQLPLELIKRFVEDREPAFSAIRSEFNSSGLVNEAQAVEPALSLWLYLVAFNSLHDKHSFEHCRFFFTEWEKLPTESKFKEVDTWADYIEVIKPSIPPRLRWELER